MQNDLKPLAGKMITDFPTAPLAPGLRRAGGGTVEKSLYASHTEILTLPANSPHPVAADAAHAEADSPNVLPVGSTVTENLPVDGLIDAGIQSPKFLGQLNYSFCVAFLGSGE